jgi:hypothetical protein
MWHLLRRGKKDTGVWCGNVRQKDTLGRTGCRWENNNEKKMEGRKMNLSG